MAGSLIVTVVAMLPMGEQIRTIAHGALTLVVDLRHLPETGELALKRTPEDAVMYISSFKKSLLAKS